MKWKNQNGVVDAISIHITKQTNKQDPPPKKINNNKQNWQEYL